MRVSGGREVTDLSGKMRIHSLPLRFMLRVRATRAASSCVLVIQARSSGCKPNSPKSIRRVREAVPLRLPRWDLRYFPRLGINGITILPRVQLPRAPGAGACAASGDEAVKPGDHNGQRDRAELEHRIVEGADVEFPAQRADLTPKAGSRNKTQADRPFTPKNRNPPNDIECLKHSS